MASFTRFLPSLRREGPGLRQLQRGILACSLLASGLLTGGCHDPKEDGHFVIEGLDAYRRPGGLSIRLHQSLGLSGEARKALRNGVPLNVDIMIELRGETGRPKISETRERYQIRYLPLSDHYELSRAGAVDTYPRLRHLLAALSRSVFAVEAGEAGPGAYEIRARSRLDKQSLPPPMRMPAILSAHWSHDSGWFKYSIELGAG